MTEESLFDLALNTPDAERAALLDRECAGDPALRARVEALLRADAGTRAFAPMADVTGTFGDAGETVDSEAAPTADYAGRGEQAGTVIAGKYTLVEPIGEGGMGSVWRAKQTEPVKRFVAVKLIKAGMDSKQVLARFEAERQALAMMDHPNIAKVLDGGIHDGRPFFVMELVKGTPITEFCDANRFTPPQRLELFVQACQAIQHAHQKGIIHRDVKPRNVLVALYDDKPVVKVIDFGVAKATGGALTEKTLDTGFGGVVGTPQYMSPEQATFNNLDIDTRSDVYALGVLLYELLAGSPPLARKELEKRGLLEILRVVREEEPPRPSTKLSTSDALPSISANRGTEPKKLAGMLRNELDWIVMKALEKDRARRYETANGFAADVQRYLSGEAVQAHPPSRAYRLKKFVRRNRPQVIAASLVLLALVAGIVGTTWGLFQAATARDAEAAERRKAEGQRNLARLQRDRARSVLDAMMSEQSVEWFSVWKGMTPNDRRFLTELVSRYRELLDDAGTSAEDADRQTAGAYARLGKLYLALSQFEESSAAFAVARREYHRLLTDSPSNTSAWKELVDAELNEVSLLLLQGRTADALALATSALSDAERSGDETALAMALSLTADCHRHLQQPAQAARLKERALTAWRKRIASKDVEPGHKRLFADVLSIHAGERGLAGDWVAAEPLYAEAFAIRQQLQRQQPDALLFQSDLGDAHINLGFIEFHNRKNIPAALAQYDTGIALLRTAHDRAVPVLLRYRLNNAYQFRADMLDAAKRFGEAARDYERALELATEEDKLPDLRFRLANALLNSLQFDRGVDVAGSVAEAPGALTVGQLVELSWRAAFFANDLTLPKPFRDRSARVAIALIRPAFEAADRPPLDIFDGPGWKGEIHDRDDFKKLLIDLEANFPPKRELLLRECLAIREKKEPDAWSTFNTRSRLGEALLGQKKYAEAEPLLVKGYEGMKAREKTIPAEGATRIPEALDRLIELYTATKKPDEVKKYRELRAKYPPELAPPPKAVK